METYSIGYKIMKPIETQEDCDKYSAMVDAINEYNGNANPGDVFWSVEDFEDRYEIVNGGIIPSTDAFIDNLKESKIESSKTELSEYLASHPIKWTDGKYYSVTSEKQSLLTSNLALYQISAAAGQNFKLTWNSTGDECVEWEYTELAALALAIGSYVKPFVSYQQELELSIKACNTLEELNAIEISYDLSQHSKKEATG